MESLEVGLGPSPMPGGFTMEHGKHSAPIGTLNPFIENVSPAERESSKDWSDDTPTGIKEDTFNGGDRAARGDAGMELSSPGQSSAIDSDDAGAEGITRLSNTTYGSPSQKPYEV